MDTAIVVAGIALVGNIVTIAVSWKKDRKQEAITENTNNLSELKEIINAQKSEREDDRKEIATLKEDLNRIKMEIKYSFELPAYLVIDQFGTILKVSKMAMREIFFQLGVTKEEHVWNKSIYEFFSQEACDAIASMTREVSVTHRAVRKTDVVLNERFLPKPVLVVEQLVELPQLAQFAYVAFVFQSSEID